MGSTSIYCRNNTSGKTSGKTSVCKLTSSTNPFILFNLTPSGGNSGVISNTQNNRLSGIVTTISINKSENIALTPTLGSSLYLYVGGESAYEIELGGVAFNSCKSSSSGFNSIVSWYVNQNVKKTGKACKLTLNSLVYKGYLHSFKVLIHPQTDNMVSFNLRFYAV